ncbi:unnamed protein product [Cuscuta campestris]|uniref:Uncharacterized protein n=1 Tax=Cuscuta campestris TaxID=132261 RepID=A0A484LJC0_9ASTE|nr:unnamed protein product [Cuscuta campestris]
MFLETQPWLNSDLTSTSLLEDLTPNHGFQLPMPDNAVGFTNIAVGLANSGGYLEPFKDVHHHERVREEVIVVGGRGDRHVDHDKLYPIDRGRVHDRVEKLEVLTGHDRVPMLLGLDDSGHDVEKEPALGVCGVDGGGARGMADELGDAKLVEDKALVVEHPVLSAIVGNIATLVGEAGDAPRLLNGKLNQRALDKKVEHVVLTPEVGVEGPDHRRVDLLLSPGDEQPKTGYPVSRVSIMSPQLPEPRGTRGEVEVNNNPPLKGTVFLASGVHRQLAIPSTVK